MFGNPVLGTVRPRGSPSIKGSFMVTSTFAEHIADKRGGGTDIGDLQCGSALLAWDDGRVAEAFVDGNGSRIVRVDSFEHPGYQYAIVHMPNFEVWVGKLVTRGQIIAHVGMSGADACHAHLGLKHNGVEIDSWPLFNQNMGEDMPQIVKWEPGKATIKAGANIRRRASMDKEAEWFQVGPNGSSASTFIGWVKGDFTAGSDLWGAYFVADKGVWAYTHKINIASITPPSVDCGSAIADAKRLWNAKIDAAQL